MQEQKAENTGRQFCSCFYQLLGIGGPGSTMLGRILGGSCGNVWLGSDTGMGVIAGSPSTVHSVRTVPYIYARPTINLLAGCGLSQRGKTDPTMTDHEAGKVPPSELVHIVDRP
ncbi:hypothetical protein V1478_001484 [Vespula squamosa]|uniref:Uncharacterized protein n=1 Tax=Vespula squamosa TaxID=30214 RepID=A0ABD2C3D0_VESSQ